MKKFKKDVVGEGTKPSGTCLVVPQTKRDQNKMTEDTRKYKQHKIDKSYNWMKHTLFPLPFSCQKDEDEGETEEEESVRTQADP